MPAKKISSYGNYFLNDNALCIRDVAFFMTVNRIGFNR